MTPRRAFDLALAGFCWGLFAYLLGRRAFPAGIWGGVTISPIIGVVVGGWLQPAFEAREGRWRALVALGSLYAAAGIFGIGVAVGDWARFQHHPGAVAVESVLSVWWGITISGFLLFLWPLAYFTHWLLEWHASR